MELTQEIVDQYVGGQLKIQNEQDGYIYQGAIHSIELTVSGGYREVTVRFKWFAKLNARLQWEVADPTPYRINLTIYSVFPISENRIVMTSSITGELAVLFPPGGSQLDPCYVHGLELDP